MGSTVVSPTAEEEEEESGSDRATLLSSVRTDWGFSSFSVSM
jgi:hypothetical protein